MAVEGGGEPLETTLRVRVSKLRWVRWKLWEEEEGPRWNPRYLAVGAILKGDQEGVWRRMKEVRVAWATGVLKGGRGTMTHLLGERCSPETR
jgi:hypothetical protein